ncbi:MAG TPA: ATP-binding protein, partial [Spirochaetota bacterium]
MSELTDKRKALGYFLFDPGDNPGIIFRDLNHQLSSAIKGAQLVATVNAYSSDLESMVHERTRKLNELNEDLKAEITKREVAERELLKQKNFESIGLLAGGIAHDFNNMLTALSANVSIMLLKDFDKDEIREIGQSMMHALENAKNLTQQLLTFSKGGAPIKKAMPIIPIIRETAQFVMRGSNVKAVFDFEDNIGNIEIDQNQICQVLNNLIINAIQAMPNGGEMSFRARSVSLPDRKKYVKISLEDTGTGIPHEYIDKIFDPYFTTKEKGSGLGLSTSLAIIKKHDGDIEVTSTPGKGSCFDIFLPETHLAPGDEKQPTDVHIPEGLRILVLEDNEEIKKILSAFVKMIKGKSVMTSDGTETIEEFRKSFQTPDSFDLVIMDLTIPGGMGGSETIESILSIDADVRAIVTSGYSDIPVLANHGDYGFRSILQKPFTFADFKAAICKAIC